jgi:hypothetical protein
VGIFDKLKLAFTSSTTPAPELPSEWPTEPTTQYGTGLDCVGESFYASALKGVVGKADQWSGVAVLLPEPKNEHDRNAVGVYLNGEKVGHLPKEQARHMHKPMLQAIAAGGVVAVEAQVTAHGRSLYQVILEPGTHEALSRPRITAVLLAAGYKPRRDEYAGFTMRNEGDRYKVFRSGDSGFTREQYVPEYAKALREAGYKARVAREDGYPYVSVTGTA